MADRPRLVQMRRAAFTLLELMLAIALTGFVMVLVGMAIDMHLRSTERRRDQVEQAQLARAILQQIAEDLRGTVLADTADFSSVEELADVDRFLPGVEDLGSELTADGVSGTNGAVDADAAVDEADEIVENIASSASVSSLLGLYGDRYALLLDVSHLPGRDELARAAAAVEIAAPTGDVKSVAYYLDNSGQASLGASQAGFTDQSAIQSPGVALGGLVRRVIDRAAERWAGAQGGSDLLGNAELLAPEVRALEFRYFDGTQWVEQWNSEELGDLPIAVEIAIAVEQTDERSERDIRGLGLEAAAGMIDPDSIFRLVVRLPTAQPVNEADQVEEEMEESSGAAEEAES